MKIIKKSLLFLLASTITLPLVAQDSKSQFNPVQYGVTSLAIAPDARAGAMGDVGAATDPDVFSQYWNPAKYPFTVSRAGLAMSYTPWLRKLVNDIDLANVVGYYRIGDYQAISASLNYFSLGEVTVRTEQTDNGYTVKPYEMSFDVAYSRMLSESFSAAVALRFIHSDMGKFEGSDVQPGSAFAADLSWYYNRYVILNQRECLWSLGMNASNIGSKINFTGGNRSVFLPTNLRIGTSLLMPINEYNTFSVSLDANKLMVPTMPQKEDGEADEDYQTRLEDDYYNISSISGIFKSFGDAPGGFKEEMQEISWSLGCEYIYHNQFSVRGGYHHESENKGNRKYYTVGAGFKMSVFSLDAGYLISASQSNPLDQTLRFSLSFDMDGLKDLMGKGRR
ncbi:MAG: type IX secretion system outer membrane channel protein PorV [Bacteroidaceae bacterium]|nr:type IX secretion system outer membrane channel protein PorV [Bacteroidaceae bacterium]